MSARGPHDAIAPAALPAIEALEAKRGTASDFAQADAELRRLVWRGDLRLMVGPAVALAAMIALNAFEQPYGYVAIFAVAIALAGFEIWWARTPRARAIKRVRRAITDWLAFGPPAHDT